MDRDVLDWNYVAGRRAARAMFVPDDAAEGMKALEEQRYEAAIASFTKVAEADPKDYAAFFHIGLAQSLLIRDPRRSHHTRKCWS